MTSAKELVISPMNVGTYGIQSVTTVVSKATSELDAIKLPKKVQLSLERLKEEMPELT